jgi:hypothetical protein
MIRPQAVTREVLSSHTKTRSFCIPESKHHSCPHLMCTLAVKGSAKKKLFYFSSCTKLNEQFLNTGNIHTFIHFTDT